MSYRSDAAHHLKLAQAELAAMDPERLRHAALELRMTMEALIYDRALQFEQELPPSEYDVWQPQKLLAVLLEIDATADQDSSFAYGEQPPGGGPPAKMHELGTERVLRLSWLEKRYNMLGSFLHVPTAKQSRTGRLPDAQERRSRCEEIVSELTQVLASPIWNTFLANFARFECTACSTLIRKRVPSGMQQVEGLCANSKCHASYTISDAGPGKVRWEPQQQELPCRGDGCGHTIFVWRREVKLGGAWTCTACGGENVLTMGILHTPASTPEGQLPRASSGPEASA